MSFFCGVVSSACLLACLKGRNEVKFVGSAGPVYIYTKCYEQGSEGTRDRESESERACASAGAGEREWGAEIRTDKRDGFED